jgi:cytochrome b
LPTRLFHWLLLVLVLALIITGHQGGDWMPWHARFGYGVLTLVLFRLVWGVVGGHHSRFVQFIPSASTLGAALRRAWRGPHQASIGHNPLGALSVMAFLLILGLQAASGLVSDDEIAFTGPLSAHVSGHVVSLATWYHKEVGQQVLIALVVLHVAAIAYYRRRHGERLVAAMVHGDKSVSDEQAALAPPSRDGLGQRLHALAWLLACGLAVGGLVQWGSGA